MRRPPASVASDDRPDTIIPMAGTWTTKTEIEEFWDVTFGDHAGDVYLDDTDLPAALWDGAPDTAYQFTYGTFGWMGRTSMPAHIERIIDVDAAALLRQWQLGHDQAAVTLTVTISGSALNELRGHIDRLGGTAAPTDKAL